MRGADALQERLLSARKLDDSVPAAQPLRPIREQVNRALKRLDDLFVSKRADDALDGRPLEAIKLPAPTKPTPQCHFLPFAGSDIKDLGD